MQEVKRKIEEKGYKLKVVFGKFLRSFRIEYNKLYNFQMCTETELKNFKKK